MLLSEFVERTGVTPNADEYARIEEEYYAFPGDKDAFCRAWKRSNPLAVAKAKEKKRLSEEHNRILNVLFRIDRYLLNHRRSDPARPFLKERDITILTRNGFRVDNYMRYDYYTIDDLRYAIDQFLKNRGCA